MAWFDSALVRYSRRLTGRRSFASFGDDAGDAAIVEAAHPDRGAEAHPRPGDQRQWTTICAERDRFEAEALALRAELEALREQLARAVETHRSIQARSHEKVEFQRERVAALKVKLGNAQRAEERAEELVAARTAAQVAKIEAGRARSEEVRLLAQLAAERSSVHPRADAGDILDATLASTTPDWAAKGGSLEQARAEFERGRRFQLQGAIGLAGACYRRAGPWLGELLVREGPGGDRVTGPDFLVIGAGRCGTTWLKKSLAHHPQIYILAGEPHYFSSATHMPPEAYVHRFADLYARFLRPGYKSKEFDRPADRLYGEKSTTYLGMPQAHVDLCAALFPKARLVCLVRDPIARVWSHLQHLEAGGVLADPEHVGQLRPEANLDELIRQGRFEGHLRRWARRYDPEQILLVDFKRIATEPQVVFDEILDHIGAAPGPPLPDPSNFKETGRREMPGWLAERLQADLAGERFDIPYLRSAMAQEAAARPL